jgi:zinc transport system substrate-binding protein
MAKNAAAGWAVPTSKIRRAQPGRRGYACFCLVCLLFLAAAEPAESKLNAFVSILPQAYIAQRIGGDSVAVSVLVGQGQSPHSYEPTPKQIAALSGADVFFTIGLPFEQRLLQKITSFAGHVEMVDTRQGISLRTEENHNAGNHNEVHAGPDPHIWLAPLLIKQQAATICRALEQKDPAHGEAYQRNFEQLAAELEALHSELSKRLAPFSGRAIFVFHPALGYFTDAYKLRQVAIEMAGKEPGSKSFAAVIDRARATGVKTIFAERQFSPKSAEAVAAQIGAEVVMIDPLGQNCLQNLSSIADQIIASFKK